MRGFPCEPSTISDLHMNSNSFMGCDWRRMFHFLSGPLRYELLWPTSWLRIFQKLRAFIYDPAYGVVSSLPAQYSPRLHANFNILSSTPKSKFFFHIQLKYCTDFSSCRVHFSHPYFGCLSIIYPEATLFPPLSLFWKKNKRLKISPWCVFVYPSVYSPNFLCFFAVYPLCPFLLLGGL